MLGREQVLLEEIARMRTLDLVRGGSCRRLCLPVDLGTRLAACMRKADLDSLLLGRGTHNLDPLEYLVLSMEQDSQEQHTR